MHPLIQQSINPSIRFLRRGRRTRNGKIARLPDATRDRVNRMIDDGFRYHEIITALGPPGTPELPYAISEMNLSNWFKGGYREYRDRKDLLDFERLHPSPDSILRESMQRFRASLAQATPPADSSSPSGKG